MRKGHDGAEALRDLRVPFASFVVKCFLALALLAPVSAGAACTGAVAGDGTRLWRAAAVDQPVAVTFLGHASFLIESPQGVKIVTDYNGVLRGPTIPDIVTMNNAHPSHYTDDIDAGIKYVLRGWDEAGGIPKRNLEYRDVKIHNVPTNRRDFGGTQYNANSIFVFDVGDLCIAHLGHLHHTLTQTHLDEMGAIDVVMVPVDGAYTLNQEDMVAVLDQIKPKVALPMHVFTQATLDRFLARAAEHYQIRRAAEPHLLLSRAGLPSKPEIVVLPGR